MKLTDEQLRSAMSFFQSICDIMAQKGYTPSHSSSIDFKDENAQGATTSCTVVYGPDDDRSYLYLSRCFNFEDPEYMAECRAEKIRFAMNVKTLKERKLGKMLDMIQEVQALAEEQGINADFVNPLTAMADQLRTNIIEHRHPTVAEINEIDF